MVDRLGMLLWVYQFNQQAGDCLQQAEALDPAEFRWPYYLGAVLAPTDRTEALAAYQRAAEVEPNIALLRIRVADFVVEIKEPGAWNVLLPPFGESVPAGCRHMPAGIENDQVFVVEVLS